MASTDTPAVPLNRQARLGLSTLKAGKELSVSSDGLAFTNDRAILPRLGSVSSEHTHKLLITREGVFAGPDGDTSLDLVLPLLLGPETPHLVAINARSDLPERELLELAWLLALNEAGFLERNTNLALFTRSESTFPELYGALGALLGSLLIMLVTATLAIPVAIAAAIWLSEFARPGRLMTTVEVSINNLAAVPSILFGLIGASVLIAGISIPWPFGDEPAVFGVGMGRGWPLVAGIVLALVVFPTVVIASRAALDAVPDQVRQSALALGATTMQTALHHVVPQALPATMTGVILGLSRAIGETPPLLLIGMLAFVADPPRGITDPSTALPVKIYDLSKSADPQWIALGAALSIILLVLMLALNACAIFLRQLAEGQE